MLVERMLPVAQKKLVTVRDADPLIDVATFLGHKDANLVVVCGSDGALTGVIAKTDIVRQISSGSGNIYEMTASVAMTRDVAVCRPGDFIADVWAMMKNRGLKHVPVITDRSWPVGLLIARDVLGVLLEEVEYEEELLREYVMCIGYQ